MSEARKPAGGGFLAELKRRRVVRVAIVYPIVGWIIVQVAAVTFPALKLPPWTVTFVVVLALLGFPTAVVLAWAFDITPEGIRRTRPVRSAKAAPGRPPEAAAPRGRAATVPPPVTVPLAKRRRVPLAFVLALGFLLGVGVLFAWFRSHPGREAAGGAGTKLLAVLPFENVGSPEDEYFADGVADAVRGKLAALPGVQVVARSSSAPYKKTTKTPQEIAQELGVGYLLTGTVRWEKGAGGMSRVQVNPELVQIADVRAPTTQWQQPFDAVLTDVFQVQADIASRVAQALDVALGTNEREKLAEKPTQNLAAYDAFLRGEEVSRGLGEADPATLRRAVAYYEQAVALDSAFVQAWAQLSRAYSLLYTNSTPNPAWAERARDAAERAIALAPASPEARVALGDYYAFLLADYERALEQYALGLRAAPKNGDLLGGTALVEMTLGRWEAALEHLERARTLDPRSGVVARRLSRALLWLRRYPEALAASDRVLEMTPTSLAFLENKAMVFLAQGDLEGARAVLRAAPKEVEPTALVAYVANFWDLFWVLEEEQQQLLLRLTPGAFDDNRGAWGIVLAQTHALRGDQGKARAYADSARIAFEAQVRESPDDPQAHVFLGLALAYLGRRAEAIREGERGLAMMPVTKDAYVGAYYQHLLARIHILIGEPEKALDQLEPLLKIPYYLSSGWLRIDPTFDPLRGHPRFQRLLAGVS